MLAARDTRNNRILALPDYEGAGELDELRELTRAGTIVCPACSELLWLRAGELRRPHFAHRVLANCPHTHASLEILEARRHLYRFFQERIQRGKLSGPIELEPVLQGLPEGTRVDLILHRDPKRPVAIVLLESALHPDVRDVLGPVLEAQGFVFRPVFLSSTLKHPEDGDALEFLLTTTQRELTHDSPYGLEEGRWGRGKALHFIAPEEGVWTSVRDLHLYHPPQLFEASSVRESAMDKLLWSDTHSEWTHPDEAKARPFPPPKPRVQVSPRPAVVEPPPPPPPVPVRFIPSSPPPPPPAPPPEPVPAWVMTALVCSGCGVRTTKWQVAAPGEYRCICKTCFAAGQRL